MKKTKLFAIVLSACIIGLSACGGTVTTSDEPIETSESSNASNTSLKAETETKNTENNKVKSKNKTSDDKNNSDNTQSNDTMQETNQSSVYDGKPVVKIVMYDQKHADLSLVKDSIVGINYNDLDELFFYFPTDSQSLCLDMDYAGNYAAFYVDGYGPNVQFDDTDSEIVFHVDLTADGRAADYGIENLSFAELDGTFILEYDNPAGGNGYQFQYEYGAITDQSSYQGKDYQTASTQDKDQSDLLVGIWELYDGSWLMNDGSELKYYEFWVFYPDHTMSRFSRRSEKELEEDLTKDEYKSGAPYTFDGEIIECNVQGEETATYIYYIAFYGDSFVQNVNDGADGYSLTYTKYRGFN